jgi:hypothetical protein
MVTPKFVSFCYFLADRDNIFSMHAEGVAFEFQSVLVDYFQKKSYYQSEIFPRLSLKLPLLICPKSTIILICKATPSACTLNMLSLSAKTLTKRNKFRRYHTSY